MKTVLTFLLLLAFNTFAQDVTVLGRIYIDTAVMSPTEYTTCDTTKTLRIMTDNDLSNIASDRLSKMYSLSNDYDNWKKLFSLHLILHAVSILPPPFDNYHFNFYEKYLNLLNQNLSLIHF